MIAPTADAPGISERWCGIFQRKRKRRRVIWDDGLKPYTAYGETVVV